MFAASLAAFASAFDIESRSYDQISIVDTAGIDDQQGSFDRLANEDSSDNVFGISDELLRTIVAITAALSAEEVEVYCGCCDSDTLDDPWENFEPPQDPSPG